MEQPDPSDPRPAGPVVGFDFDLTLGDSGPGIVATLRRALAEHGHPVAADDVAPHLGIPLEDMVAASCPAADAAAVAARYVELYPVTGIPVTGLLPGVPDVLHAVRAAGGRTLVVSAKRSAVLAAVLDHVGLAPGGGAVDEALGGLFAEAKGEALRGRGADVYVGDHPGDMAAARVAGALAVGVTTGSHGAAALRRAGADEVLPGLVPLPALLRARGLLPATPDGPVREGPFRGYNG